MPLLVTRQTELTGPVLLVLSPDLPTAEANVNISPTSVQLWLIRGDSHTVARVALL